MGGVPATVAFTVLWPTVVPWLAAALLPLLLAWLAVRDGRRVRWAATDLVAAAARRAGIGRHGMPTVLVALRAIALAAIALAAARPFLSSRSPSRGVPVVAGVADRSIEIVVPDPAADDAAAVAIRGSLEALAATSAALTNGGVPTIEIVSPQSAAAAFTGRRLVILCDGVVPDAADARRLEEAVRAGTALLVCLGPDSTSPSLRPRLSAWLHGLGGIDVAGVVPLRDAAIDGHGLGDGEVADLLAGPTVARAADIAFPADRWTVLVHTCDGGRPLVAETAVGKGRVCIATIPLALPGAGADDAAWSDLAAWPAFVPFIDRLASHLLAPASGRAVAASSPLAGAGLARPLLGVAAAAVVAEWLLAASLATSAPVPWLGRVVLLAVCGGMALLWGGTPRARPAPDLRRRPVALLVDASPSMATRDVDADAGAARSRIAAVQEAFSRDGGRVLRAVAQGRGLALATTGTWSADDGDVTAVIAGVQAIVPAESATHASRIGDAIASLLTAADPPAAVVVASDGAISDGSSWADVARLARSRRVPLVAIPVGDDSTDGGQPLPTGFRFTGIEGPAVGRPDERLPLMVAAAATVPHRRSLPLAVTNGSGSLAALPADDGGWLLHRFAGRCDDRIDAAASRGTTATLTRTVRAGATADRGHAATLPVVVASAPIRVLLVDTAPRYEYRFLDRLLAGDPRFEVTSVLLESRDRKEARPTGSLPESIDGWNAFDAVVIGDVPIATAADDAPAWAALATAAARHGIGIAWLPGRRWARDDAGRRSWLPATSRGGGRTAAPRRLAIAEAAGGGWFSWLDDRPADAGPFAPEIYAVLDAIDCGPTARVVAVATDLQATMSAAAAPAIVTARVGAATVLAHFCETWRWRDATGDDLHSRYWLHALGRLAERHLLARLVDARLEQRPCDPIAGETVWIDVVPTRDDVSLAGWIVEVEAEGAQSRRVSIEAGAAGAVATIPLAGLPAGRHAVRLVPSGEPPAGEQALIRREIVVNEPAVETAGGPAGTGPFVQAARASGGAVVPLDRLDALPDTISRLDAARAAAAARAGPSWFESQAFAHLLVAAAVATGLMAWRPRTEGGW